MCKKRVSSEHITAGWEIVRRGTLAALLLSLLVGNQVVASMTTTAMALNTPRVVLVGTDLTREGAQIGSTIASSFAQAGIRIEPLRAEELSDPQSLRDVHLVVWAGATAYPAKAVRSLVSYLNNGGHLLALGAPAFSNPLFWLDGAWQSRRDYEAQLKKVKPERVLLDFESQTHQSDWQRATNDFLSPGSITFPVEDGNRVMYASVANLSGWDTWRKAIHNLGDDKAIFSLRAKGGPNTSQLAVELQERDGSRWIATVPIKPEWETYSLWPEEFHYWKDNPSVGRGRPGDQVRFSQVTHIIVGLAYTHTALPHGPHEYWIDDVGTLPDTLSSSLRMEELPPLDGLHPEYKYYPVEEPTVQLSQHQVFVEDLASIPVDVLASVHPRPQGTGFMKERRRRFVPLIETQSADGRRNGYLAWTIVHGSYGQNQYAGGVWTVFSPTDPTVYATGKLAESVLGAAKAMLRGSYLLEGGTTQFAYFTDQQELRLGTQVMRLPTGPAIDTLQVSWSVRQAEEAHVLFADQQSLASGRVLKGLRNISYVFNTSTWRPETLSPGLYLVTVELRCGEQLIDRLQHEVNVWEPKPETERQFVTVEDGSFSLDGERWFAYGVNYMPSSGIALEDNDVFEYFLSKASYDPAIFEEDLERITALGFNMISVFLYYRDVDSWNLLDLLVRAERHGLKVNLSLRPHADPLHFSPAEIAAMITTYRLAENDTVMAYDLAWERSWGEYEPSYGNVVGRKGYDNEWQAWMERQYGSISQAEADWGVPVPRTSSGQVTGPSNQQLDQDGPWRAMVAAYRRFVDDFVGKKHLEAAEFVRSLDSSHLVSFRMGGDGGNPTAPGRVFGYDFKGLAPSMDIMQPEGYGRIGDWEKVKPGMFTETYSRYAAPFCPVLWAEMGTQVWSGSNFEPSDVHLHFQADFYRDFFEMVRQSHADGVVAWWFPGGYRFNEKSDFGILNPDYSDRPVTSVIREYAPILTNKPARPAPDYWIEIDRDRDSRGLFGIYANAKDEYWQALSKGLMPGLRDAGMGTTSIDTPLIAVGNKPYTGENPPKYLNAMFKRLEIKIGSEPWRSVHTDQTITVPASQSVYIRGVVANTEVATWIAPTTEQNEQGTVHLAAAPGSQLSFQAPIAHDVPYLGTVEIPATLLLGEVKAKAEVVLRMTSWDRCWFGEPIKMTFLPE